MSITKSPIIEQLTAGMQLIYDGNRLFTVDDDLATQFKQQPELSLNDFIYQCCNGLDGY